MVHVAEAFGVKGLGGEELALCREGQVATVVVVVRSSSGSLIIIGFGEEPIAHYPRYGCALEGRQVPIGHVSTVKGRAVAAASATAAIVGVIVGGVHCFEGKEDTRQFFIGVAAVGW